MVFLASHSRSPGKVQPAILDGTTSEILEGSGMLHGLYPSQRGSQLTEYLRLHPEHDVNRYLVEREFSSLIPHLQSQIAP